MRFRGRRRLSARFTNASARDRASTDRISRSACLFLYDRDIYVTVAYLAFIQAIPHGALTWGHEGHQI